MQQAIHFEGSRDPKFQEKWFRQCDALEEGAWGKRRRIFHHEFNGEGFEILPGQSYVRQGDLEPYAALVWSGRGNVVAMEEGKSYEPLELQALHDTQSEFLVAPGTTVKISNSSETATLYIYTVLPICNKKSWFVAPEDWKD